VKHLRRSPHRPRQSLGIPYISNLDLHFGAVGIAQPAEILLHARPSQVVEQQDRVTATE
jgi:hypothetical protein